MEGSRAAGVGVGEVVLLDSTMPSAPPFKRIRAMLGVWCLAVHVLGRLGQEEYLDSGVWHQPLGERVRDFFPLCNARVKGIDSLVLMHVC